MGVLSHPRAGPCGHQPKFRHGTLPLHTNRLHQHSLLFGGECCLRPTSNVCVPHRTTNVLECIDVVLPLSFFVKHCLPSSDSRSLSFFSFFNSLSLALSLVLLCHTLAFVLPSSTKQCACFICLLLVFYQTSACSCCKANKRLERLLCALVAWTCETLLGLMYRPWRLPLRPVVTSCRRQPPTPRWSCPISCARSRLWQPLSPFFPRLVVFSRALGAVAS
jgi:hypothetical protein